MSDNKTKEAIDRLDKSDFQRIIIDLDDSKELTITIELCENCTCL